MFEKCKSYVIRNTPNNTTQKPPSIAMMQHNTSLRTETRPWVKILHFFFLLGRGTLLRPLRLPLDDDVLARSINVMVSRYRKVNAGKEMTARIARKESNK